MGDGKPVLGRRWCGALPEEGRCWVRAGRRMKDETRHVVQSRCSCPEMASPGQGRRLGTWDGSCGRVRWGGPGFQGPTRSAACIRFPWWTMLWLPAGSTRSPKSPMTGSLGDGRRMTDDRRCQEDGTKDGDNLNFIHVDFSSCFRSINSSQCPSLSSPPSPSPRPTPGHGCRNESQGRVKALAWLWRWRVGRANSTGVAQCSRRVCGCHDDLSPAGS